MPEPLITSDGADKNAGERQAATRLVATLRQDHPTLQLMVTEESLRANAPHIPVLRAHHLHDIVGVKEGVQADVFAQVAPAERAGRVPYDDRHETKTALRHRLRCISDVPLHETHADLRVNFLACWEWDRDTVQHYSWVTALRVNTGTVSQIMHGGRARWRIDNATCNTLKDQGYHLCAHLWPWRSAPRSGVCCADAVGVCGGLDPTALLPPVASRVGETREQTPPLGTGWLRMFL